MVSLTEIKKKIILLGDGAVGKTSLIRRFVVDKFNDNYLQTVGFKITSKDLQITADKKVYYLKLNIWDILGQKGYIELHKSSLPGTAGVFLVADITRKDTLQSIEDYWIPNVQNIVGPVPFVILANKSDLVEDAEFDEEELRQFAHKYEVSFYLTSAKTGENVKNAFQTLGENILESKELEPPKPAKMEVIEGEESKIAKLIDKIIVDFCKEYGRSADAMPVLRRQFELAKLDLNRPNPETIRKAIERLASVEIGFKNRDTVEANRLKRLKWVKEFELS
ncbi:MAG: GTP-binding protein [Methanomassiliicoccales archaeon]|nr:MAG: GTP-binding protein [Methanomassiliicoccales archaeon]